MTYKAKTTEITAVDGVSVDITVRGDEDKAEKVLMELKDRLGYIAEAYETQTPPDKVGERASKNTPPISIDWESVLEE